MYNIECRCKKCNGDLLAGPKLVLINMLLIENISPRF